MVLAFLQRPMDKILVIEDDELVRGSVTLSLESAGYVVMEAATCQEGLQSHKQFSPSVIISDAVSLENEGGEILRRLCQQSANLPLITLMGTLSDFKVGSSSVEKSSPAVSSYTLHKPFTLDELLEMVEGALVR